MAISLSSFLKREKAEEPTFVRQTTQEEQAPFTPVPSEIRQAPPRKPIQKVEDFLRKSPITRPLVEGLFGVREAERKAFAPEEPGIVQEAAGRGVLGFLYQGVLKSQRQQVEDRFNNLTREGVDPRRATQVAIQDVLDKQKKSIFKFSVKKEEEPDRIAATEQEKKVLRKAGLFEAGEKALEALDVLSFGTFGVLRKGATLFGKKVMKELVDNTSETVARQILKKQLPKAPPEFIDDAARATTRAGTEDEVLQSLSNPQLFLEGKGGIVEEVVTGVREPAQAAIQRVDRNIANFQRTGEAVVGDRQPRNAALEALQRDAEIPEIKTAMQARLQSAIDIGFVKTNPDGTITLFRAGAPVAEDRLVSATFDKDVAQLFIDKADGKIPITEFKVKPEDVKIFVGQAESEVLVTSAQLKQAKRAIGLDKAPVRTSKVQQQNIQTGVNSTIPLAQSLLRGAVDQELVRSEIVSALPPSKHGDVTLSIAKENSNYRKAETGVKEAWIRFRETVQDSFIRVRKLQAEVLKGKAIPDDINIDQARTLFDGRVHSRMQEVQEIIVKTDKDIVNTAKKLAVDADSLTDDVNRYLWAKHAPERNQRLGDGAAGITTQQANNILAEINKSANAKEIIRIADDIATLNKRTLQILLDGEVIDKDLFDLLNKTYKNHVPLQRVLDEGDDVIEVLSGKGFDVRGSGIKRAKGSEKDVADIFTNIVTNVEQAIIRAEKNIVDLTTLRFARANKGLGLFEEVRPKAIGQTFADVGEEGKPILERIDDPLVLSLREKGKPVFLKINDKRLALALKGVNVENIPSLMRGISSITRLYAGLHTRFNYEFAFSNNIRDIQEMMVFVSSRKEMGFGSAGKAALQDPKSKKAVFDFLAGRDTEGSRLYKQMKNDGGTTGGLGLSTKEQVKLDIEKIRKVNRSNTRKGAETAVAIVDKWNTLFEDATRLSVYRTALDKGLTRKEAAALAKEATINFNKKGTAGPIINGLYMFSNASIQGSTKVLKAMKNPKVAGAVVSSMGLSIYAANEWNDSVDPEWRSKVTKWDRSSNLVIMIPTEDESAKYITVPISWGLKPIKVSLEYLYDASTGHGDIQDAAQGIMTSVLEAYNPLAGDEDILNTVTPTILKTPVEIARNRAWYGNAIKPDYDKDIPASAQYFSSLENSVIGRAAIAATREISQSTEGAIELSPADVEYATNQYMGGVGRSISKIISAVAAIGEGELEARERPVLSRFLKDRPEEQVLQSLYFNEKEKVDKKKAREKVEDVRRITPLYEDAQMLLREGKRDQAQVIVDGLTDEDYDVYKKMLASDKRRQTTAAQVDMFSTVLDVQELLDDNKRDEAQKIIDEMTDVEFKAYKSVRKQLGLE